MQVRSIEKIGGTSMLDYEAVRDNIVLRRDCKSDPYGRVIVVSAYAGITNGLLEHKKSGQPGVFALFASSETEGSWLQALSAVREQMYAINSRLFGDSIATERANRFVRERLDSAESCLRDLQRLCKHGHFSLEEHLSTVREMLASVGEAQSAWNTSQLLARDGINAQFLDLTGWRDEKHLPLDTRIRNTFLDCDLSSTLPIVTGYAHTEDGLMSTFDRGYTEMTFSRIAVLLQADEAIIHKEFHLSSADPKLVGEDNAVPIGRTNYDVADQLANLGMEAIHPKAAKGLRQNGIPLRVRNTFEPEHAGTLITPDYVSHTPCVEIIAGSRGIFSLEVFDQDMAGEIGEADRQILSIIKRFRARVVAKDCNANSITHYLSCNLKTVKRLRQEIGKLFPEAAINQTQVAVVSAIGSDLQVNGLLAKTVNALAAADIGVQAMHQSMRQIDMQFVVKEDDYEAAVASLHKCLVEVHDHGRAICLA